MTIDYFVLFSLYNFRMLLSFTSNFLTYNLNSALNYNEEGTGTFILNALKIAL